MGDQFQNYKKGLKRLKIETLDERRNKLCLSFAKKCLRNDKVKSLFPLNQPKHKMKKRKTKKYEVFKSRTERHKRSALPYMRNLLNSEHEQNKLLMEGF